MQKHCPESGEEAVILLEDLERELDEPQHKVGREIHQGKYVLVTKDLCVPCFVSP